MDQIEEKKKEIKKLWEEGKDSLNRGLMLPNGVDIYIEKIEEAKKKYIAIVSQNDYENFLKFHKVGEYIETAQFLIGVCKTILAKSNEDLEKAKEELQKVISDYPECKQLVEFAKEIIEDIDSYLSLPDLDKSFFNYKKFLETLIVNVKRMGCEIKVLYPEWMNEVVSKI